MTPETPAGMRNTFDLALRFGGAALVAVGAFLVVRPFISALLVAGVLAVSTWPMFEWLLARLRGRNTLAAIAMTLLLVALVVVPLVVLASAAAEQVPAIARVVRGWFELGITVPASIRQLPLVGAALFDQLDSMVSGSAELTALVKRLAEPASRVALAAVVLLGDGVLQVLLVTFIVFFFYRDGEALAASVRRFSRRLSGRLDAQMLGIVVNTTRSVMFGLVGTAVAQGAVALVGFLIAGVPGALLLGLATALLSLVPVGPPLLWGGAAIWLWSGGQQGWAIFMVLWGALAVSSVDNFLKPLLISRGSNLPLALIFLGVFGGVLAFGFIGLILGPVLIALAIALGRAWLQAPAEALGERPETAR